MLRLQKGQEVKANKKEKVERLIRQSFLEKMKRSNQGEVRK